MAKKYKHQKYFTFEDRRYVVRADTLEELAVKEYKKRQEIEGKVKTIDREMLVRDWINEWLETYKEPTVSPDSYIVYKRNITKHTIPYIGSMKMKSVKPTHLQKILNNMHKNNLSTSYMEFISVMLNEIFREAERNGLVISNPADGLTIPKGTYSESRALTEYEENLCRQLAETHPFGIIAMLMLECGLRTGEAAALRWCDVDLNSNIMHVRNTIKGHRTVIGPTKTKAGIRDIPIPARFAEHLKSIKGDPFSFVVTNTPELLPRHQIQNRWKSFVNDLNVLMGCEHKKGKALPPLRTAPDLRPYFFRHTYCTHLQDAGVPINIARQFMGHSSILITQQIYTHATEKSFESARKLIDKNNEGVATTTATPSL